MRGRRWILGALTVLFPVLLVACPKQPPEPVAPSPPPSALSTPPSKRTELPALPASGEALVFLTTDQGGLAVELFAGAKVVQQGPLGAGSPFQAILKPGHYRLRVTKAEHHLYEEGFELTSGKLFQKKVHLEEAYGWLDLTVVPEDAHIVVDSVPLPGGTRSIKLSEGTHRVEVTAGEKWVPSPPREVRIPDSARRVSLRVELEPRFGTLHLETEPSGVRVTLNGADVGKTPFRETELLAGRYEVCLELALYDRQCFAVEVVARGEIKPPTVKLTPNFGEFSLRGTPAGASVFRSGERQPIGSLPVEVLAPRDVFVRAEQADFLSGADLRASRLGYAPRGATLRATGRSGDFYRVEIEGGQLVWIAAADVSEVPIVAASGTTSQAAPVRIVLESFPPPAIVLTSPAPGTVTDQEQVELLGGIRAVGASLVTETQVFVNGEAVGEEGKGHDIAASAGRKQRVDFRRTLALRIGENQIEVVAKDDRGLTAREILIVRRVEPRGPVGKLPPLEALSDVDRYILDPARPQHEPNPRRWAVIIGIEKYQRTVGAPFARRDAYIMHEYARKLLGVPLENIFLRVDEDATGNALKGLFRF